MSLPIPWNQLEEPLRDPQDYGTGAQRLSDFFKSKEEKYGLDELIEILLLAHPASKWLERFLFSLLDIGASDRQIGARALELRRVRRLWARFSAGIPMSPEETRILGAMEPIFARTAEEREAWVASARETFARLLAGEAVGEDGRAALATLVRAEAEALRDRVVWLSGNTDLDNLKTMARVLPRLRLYDEAVVAGLKLAGRLEKAEPVGAPVLSFEMHMQGAFGRWRGKLAEKESLRPLLSLVEQQREKKIPTLDLVALASLCRWCHEAGERKSGPLEWVAQAISSWREGGEFEVEAGEAAPMLSSALVASGVKAKGTRLHGHFGKKLYPALMGRDLLTKPFAKAADEGLLDMKSVLAQNITRDSMIEALLNNPKVQQAPGLVAFVAETSRSLAILSRIAKTRALHSGFANKDVPLALLRSPCNIPVSLLRPFINVRNVPLVDLRNLARAKAGVRREVKMEVESFLDSRA